MLAGSFLAMRRVFLQRAVADELAYLAPHRLPFGFRFADITEALGPAHHCLDLYFDRKPAGHQPPGLGHDLSHSCDRGVELLERDQDPECVVHRRGNRDATFSCNDSGEAQHITTGGLRWEIHQTAGASVGSHDLAPAEGGLAVIHPVTNGLAEVANPIVDIGAWGSEPGTHSKLPVRVTSLVICDH